MGNIPWNKGRHWKKKNIKYLDDSTIRYCPKCKKELQYSSKWSKIYAESDKKVCHSCANRINSKKVPCEFYELSRKRMINNNPCKRPDVKRKLRLSAIKRISDRYGQVSPNYNISACKIIDDYGKKHGYNFKHALNGGEYYIDELGYWVDGYDEKKNVVIEFDEPAHFVDGKLKEKDILRQKEIETLLKCQFIRLNSKENV